MAMSRPSAARNPTIPAEKAAAKTPSRLVRPCGATQARFPGQQGQQQREGTWREEGCHPCSGRQGQEGGPCHRWQVEPGVRHVAEVAGEAEGDDAPATNAYRSRPGLGGRRGLIGRCFTPLPSPSSRLACQPTGMAA